MPTPIKIEPPRVCIDLDRDAVLGACCEHLFDVDVVARAAKQLPAVICPRIVV